jgi:hypothetical protein
MPFNLMKKYNELLEIGAMSPVVRTKSLRAVFDRDISNNPNFSFRKKAIYPTPKEDGIVKMDILFDHLTKKVVDEKTKSREFDNDRSQRLHWIKYHIDENKLENVLIYSVKEPNGKRTYIYDKDEKYVVILEPLRSGDAYYLLTAYYVKGKDAKRNKFVKKYKLRLDEVL